MIGFLFVYSAVLHGETHKPKPQSAVYFREKIFGHIFLLLFSMWTPARRSRTNGRLSP